MYNMCASSDQTNVVISLQYLLVSYLQQFIFKHSEAL